mmetsp:Transcript_30611/g.64766  ORF Transcript_30611/g.64766 Transcript_30611/m.64766 type:complete len:253 (-) Transcript_30611:612-1370(-)
MNLESLVEASSEFFLVVFFAEAAVLSSALLLRFLEDFGVFASFFTTSSSWSLLSTASFFFFLEDFGVLVTSLTATSSLVSIGSFVFFLDDFGVFATTFFSTSVASIDSFLFFLDDFFGFSSTTSASASTSTAFDFFNAFARGVLAATVLFFFPFSLSSFFSSICLPPSFFTNSIISSNSSGVLLYIGSATLDDVLMDIARILDHLRGTLVGTMVVMDSMLARSFSEDMEVFPALTVTHVPALRYINVDFKDF